MENFKIKNFRKDNPTRQFPKFRSLNSFEIKKVYHKLAVKLGLFPTVYLRGLTEYIDSIEMFIEKFNSMNNNFDLFEVFNHLNIQPEETIYINWYRYDDIDEINFTDLVKYFNDIWYPGSDDVDIFDPTFSWILSISHEGSIKFIRV